MTALPRLDALTPTDGPWRIDWFGNVGYPGSIRRYSQPSIKVSISPVLEPKERYLPFRLIDTDLSQQRDVWLPLSSLGMLQVGDIWQDGRLAAKPDYFAETFKDLEIGPDTVVRIKAGLPIDGHYLLPFSEHPWHQKHTNAYCLAVEAGERQIIIPCLELIRFYFGSSGILLKRLFTRPFKEEAFWRESHFNPERRHLHLKLADGMPKYAVPDLARIATDEHAQAAAATIYASCLNTASDAERYPYMSFPFLGKTTLKASGMWLPFGDKPKQTFLVFSLHLCSHSFAFDSLTYDPCERAPWRERNAGNDEGQRQPGSRAGKKPEAVLYDSDPGNRKALRHFFFDDSMRFPDLRHKPIRPREIVAMGAKEILQRHADGTLEKVSFGEPEGSGEARAIDVGLADPPPVIAPPGQKLPDFVVTGMAVTRAMLPGGGYGVEAKPLLRFGETEPVFPLPMVVDEDGVVLPELMFTEGDGLHRVKRACFVGFFKRDAEIRKVIVVEGADSAQGPRICEASDVDILPVLSGLWG